LTMISLDSSAARRDKLNILVEILAIARKGAPKTRIMYQANVNFAGINDYLEFLLKTHLLTKSSGSKRITYKSTQKGLAVLDLYGQLSELISEDNSFENQTRIPPIHLLAK